MDDAEQRIFVAVLGLHGDLLLAAVLLLLTGDPNKLKETFKAVLYYGAGLDPYCDIVDEKDIAVPAFGPIALGLAGEVASYGHGQ